MRRATEITRFRAAVAPVALLALAIMCLALLPRSAVAIAPETQVKPPRQDYNSGAYLYRTFCAPCHGEGGAGDGPVAGSLRARPPDLATIAARPWRSVRSCRGVCRDRWPAPCPRPWIDRHADLGRRPEGDRRA